MNPNSVLTNINIGQARLAQVEHDQARVGEWLTGHPNFTKVLGRFATKFLDAHQRTSPSVEPAPIMTAMAVEQGHPAALELSVVNSSSSIPELLLPAHASVEAQAVLQPTTPGQAAQLINA